MKCTKVLNLFLASVMLVTIAAGCKRNPKNITNIPGQPPTRVGEGDRAQPVGAGNPLPMGPGATGAPIKDIRPGDEMNQNEDRTALAPQTVYFE